MGPKGGLGNRRGVEESMAMENDLITHPISKLIGRIAVPASVGYFFNTMFNVVDIYFGGLISTEALAALSLSFPVFFVILSMGTGISTGATALIGNAVGGGRALEAKDYATQSITFGLIAAGLLTGLGLYVSPFLFRALGASDSYLMTALKYMDGIFLGTVFFMSNYMLNSILYALGDTKTFRNFLIFGFFLNVVLDPWFVYGGAGVPSLGISGIALATVIVQMLGCLYLGRKVARSGLTNFGSLRRILPNPKIYAEIARQGLPASVNMMTVGMGIFIITYFISKFGREAVAAYGIATRVEQIVLLPTIGLNIATLTIVAQNNGAKLFDRIMETVNRGLLYGGVVMGLGTVGVFLFARTMMGLFTADEEVIEAGAAYLRIAAFVLYAYVILYVNVAALQGVKRPLYAIWIGLYRQIAAPIAVFSLLIYFLEFGLMGVWWGIFSVTWSAAIFTLYYAKNVLRKTAREDSMISS